MLQQRAERKALKHSIKRNGQICHLNEESCLTAAHLQSLKEKLEAKRYIHRELEPESGGEYRGTLGAHLSLHKAFRVKRPTIAQCIRLLGRAEKKPLCSNNNEDSKFPDVLLWAWLSGNDTESSPRVRGRKDPTTDVVIKFGEAAFSIVTIDDEINNLDKYEEPMGIQCKLANWIAHKYDPYLPMVHVEMMRRSQQTSHKGTRTLNPQV